MLLITLTKNSKMLCVINTIFVYNNISKFEFKGENMIQPISIDVTIEYVLIVLQLLAFIASGITLVLTDDKKE